MINSLFEKIDNFLTKEKKGTYYNNDCFLILLFLKNKCDKGIITYEEVIKNDKYIKYLDDYEYLNDFFRNKFQFIKVNKLLSEVQYIDIKELLMDYIKNRLNNSVIYGIYPQEKKLCIPNSMALYDLYGKTTYIIDDERSSASEIFLMKLFDEILNVNNKYLNMNEIILSDYDTIYYYDNEPRYKYINSKIIFDDCIRKFINSGLKIVVFTNYSKVNNFKAGRGILNYLSYIILSNSDKVVMIFNKVHDNNISIINYDEKSINSLNKLITTNRKKKNVLIKVLKEDIIRNNMRIGFKLYQGDNVEEIFDINSIVDENTRLIQSLNNINDVVEKEINYLLNK